MSCSSSPLWSICLAQQGYAAARGVGVAAAQQVFAAS